MNIGIMQPYFFPYIGYFKLIESVDKFIFLEDVNYINKGWINRNKINLHGKEYLFTVPLEKATQNKKINEIYTKDFQQWRIKWTKTLEMGYKKRPYYEPVMQLIFKVLNIESTLISDLAKKSIIETANYIWSEEIIKFQSSETNVDSLLSGPERIVQICLDNKATNYFNLPGGREYYDEKIFTEVGIKLNFINIENNNKLNNGLSIVDALMNYSPEEIRKLI